MKYACSFCDYKNYSSFTIKYHQKSRHSSIQNESLRILRIGCILCQENKEHMKHFISLEGGKRTTKVRNRKRKSKEGKFACMQEGCMYRSNFSQVVKEHYERIHLEMLRYSCNLCPYKAYLKQMVRVHQQNKLCNKEPKRVLRIGCILCEQNVKHKNHFKNDPPFVIWKVVKKYFWNVVKTNLWPKREGRDCRDQISGLITPVMIQFTAVPRL